MKLNTYWIYSYIIKLLNSDVLTSFKKKQFKNIATDEPISQQYYIYIKCPFLIHIISKPPSNRRVTSGQLHQEIRKRKYNKSLAS